MRVLVLYAEAPDADRYAAHVELCRRVGGGVFRHGPVFGGPSGEPRYRYVAEWEFPDRAAFDAAVRTAEFAATGKDAVEMGGRLEVLFAELDA